MKTKNIIMFSFLILFTASSQAVDSPIFIREDLRWGQHYSKIKKQLSPNTTKEIKTNDNRFVKNKDKYFLLTYSDSLRSEKISVGLQFSVYDSCLKSVIISYFGIDPITKKQYTDYDSRKYALLGMLTEHYPSDYQERSIPFMGKMRIWTLKNMRVQAQILSNSLMLIMNEM